MGMAGADQHQPLQASTPAAGARGRPARRCRPPAPAPPAAGRAPPRVRRVCRITWSRAPGDALEQRGRTAAAAPPARSRRRAPGRRRHRARPAPARPRAASPRRAPAHRCRSAARARASRSARLSARCMRSPRSPSPCSVTPQPVLRLQPLEGGVRGIGRGAQLDGVEAGAQPPAATAWRAGARRGRRRRPRRARASGASWHSRRPAPWRTRCTGAQPRAGSTKRRLGGTLTGRPGPASPATRRASSASAGATSGRSVRQTPRALPAPARGDDALAQAGGRATACAGGCDSSTSSISG